ncbi:hypothetical protein MMC14_007339 [Varicellaria rhodocarpa]|nr:hypothetical protein [Varicellaria rhodocarpa]
MKKHPSSAKSGVKKSKNNDTTHREGNERYCQIEGLRCPQGNVYNAKELAQKFSSELDQNSMMQARRYPLGDAAKMWVDVGDLDFAGDPAPRSAYYYKRYRGLQLLCGEEGAHLFKVRPSYEDKSKDLFNSRLGFEAVVQEPETGLSKRKAPPQTPVEPDEEEEDHQPPVKRRSGESPSPA